MFDDFAMRRRLEALEKLEDKPHCKISNGELIF